MAVLMQVSKRHDDALTEQMARIPKAGLWSLDKATRIDIVRKMGKQLPHLPHYAAIDAVDAIAGESQLTVWGRSVWLLALADSDVRELWKNVGKLPVPKNLWTHGPLGEPLYGDETPSSPWFAAELDKLQSLTDSDEVLAKAEEIINRKFIEDKQSQGLAYDEPEPGWFAEMLGYKK